MKAKTEISKIRPAARLISTIGKDLVGDAYSAVVELVKNAYDADASYVEITFDYTNVSPEPTLRIDIKDDGHGMSYETVINKWLVPATKDKLDRKATPRGRLFQGRKGIGRYAAAVLGQELVLKTIDHSHIQTEILVDWDLFDTEEYLEDVEILIHHKMTNLSPGTLLSITAKNTFKDRWGRAELALLTQELRKLKSPFKDHNPDTFDIRLFFYNCPFEEYNETAFEIEAFPIGEFFDYRISGTIDERGFMKAFYQNKVEPNLPNEEINRLLELPELMNYPGPVHFDIRAFDRDPEAIENLIDKGLVDPVSHLRFSKLQARRLLDIAYGVNLYREGFRIRPYGNGGIDWLDLDKKRIQEPSKRLSNNQIIGFINVKPEEISGLEEKSARDGLKQNGQYFGLVYLLNTIVKEIEIRRFVFRLKTGRGRKAKSVTESLNDLFDFATLTKEIDKTLKTYQLTDKAISDVIQIINRESEHKSKTLQNIQNTIAIYQGQATLGKIVTVLLHEGRKPISYFRQQSTNLIRWMKHYKAKKDWEDDLYYDILNRLDGIQNQTDTLSSLFRRLDPLAKQNKGVKRTFQLKLAIQKAIDIFEEPLISNDIKLDFECDQKIMLEGWEEDIIMALANLIENSIYWLAIGEPKIKAISIYVLQNETLTIHYKDNGPGIDKDLIESGAIFEPGFSKKLHGTGLGLPIAGEALERNGGILLAHSMKTGAYFTLEFS